MQLTRREWLKFGALLAVAPELGSAWAETSVAADQNAWVVDGLSNFHAIYDNEITRADFFPFLQNVYHLYPEQALHRLIAASTASNASDRAIYLDVQKHLKAVKPLLGDVRYSLPALKKQKKEMSQQTLQLLGNNRKIDGYLEVGTTGRYISALKPHIQLSGDTILLHTDKPSFSPVDIAERGQISPLGRFVPLNDYAAITPADIADGSLDLVTNFIGFHHAPSERLDGFVASLHRVLRPGGRMIVRDHDVDSAHMNHVVALAHDVFNMGLHAEWQSNQQEIRHFTSLAQLRSYLESHGFRSSPQTLYQAGDPTHNALMVFTRV